jgi:gamma-glutamyltranspeptidase
VAVVNTALRSIVDARPLAEAVSAPRLVATSRPDRIFVESGFDAPARAALEARGHRVEQGSQFGQVSAILCFGGLKLDPLGCQFVTDRRGFGLAVGGTDR